MVAQGHDLFPRVVTKLHDDGATDDIDGALGWPDRHGYSTPGDRERFRVGCVAVFEMTHAAPQAHHSPRMSAIREVERGADGLAKDVKRRLAGLKHADEHDGRPRSRVGDLGRTEWTRCRSATKIRIGLPDQFTGPCVAAVGDRNLKKHAKTSMPSTISSVLPSSKEAQKTRPARTNGTPRTVRGGRTPRHEVHRERRAQADRERREADDLHRLRLRRCQQFYDGNGERDPESTATTPSS